jgi:membrane metalloprotease YhfC-like protein
MQNIDPVVLLGPVIYIAISAGLVAYWRLRRRLTVLVLVLALVAYAGAFAVKVVFQAFTAGAVTSAFGAVSWQTGLYFGAQTSVLEVGLAYVVARYAFSRNQIGGRDGEAYGISLAFWENGILIGALTLLNLSVAYILIAEGLYPSPVYQALVTSSPSLFDPPQQLLVPIAFGVLERISSLLAHFAWGYLCVMAVCMRKRTYLVIAMPMGLVDALVPFAQEVPLWEFETVIFAVSVGLFVIAWAATKAARESGYSLTPVKN